MMTAADELVLYLWMKWKHEWKERLELPTARLIKPNTLMHTQLATNIFLLLFIMCQNYLGCGQGVLKSYENKR